MLQLFAWLLLISFVLVMMFWLVAMIASWPGLVVALIAIYAGFYFTRKQRKT